MPIDRRTIEELVTLHALESDLREVFVEGLADKYFFEYFLTENDLSSVAVYEIDTVEVPTSAVLGRGLEDGHRGRVITLACLLEDQVDPSAVVCVADADFDHFKKIVHDCALLLVSDYSSLELYAFNPQALGKLLRLVATGFPKNPTAVLDCIREPLETMFLIRLANQELALGCTVPEVINFCTYDPKSDKLAFRRDDFIVRLLRYRPNDDSHKQIVDFVKEGRKQLSSDARGQIHGHDFCELLAWFIRQHTGFKTIHSTTIITSVMACLECSWLSKNDMFSELLVRLTQ